MSLYINPYTDFGFKKLFGEEANKVLLIDFLNQLLPPHHQIADLHFRNVEALSEAADERKAFFDIHCEAVSGERFIVEMQKAKVRFFKDRALFYTTYPIREQAQRGPWSFELSAIYFVAILDFLYDEETEKALFLREVSLKDQQNSVFYDKLHFKFLQMPAFTKQEHELETQFDKWAFFLKNLESLDHIPAILKEPIFEKAFETAKVANLPQDQQFAYEASRLNYFGIKAVYDTAVEDGQKIGIEIGRQQGMQQGMQQGIEKGIELGEAKKEAEAILGLHKIGLPAAQIAVGLGISAERVQQVLENQ